MKILETTCARCGRPMQFESDCDQELWAHLCRLLLCKACEPQREPRRERQEVSREVRLPYADD
jgi:hypothetical protein